MAGEFQEELIKVKRQGVREVITAVKVILILGDKSHLTKLEKHSLKELQRVTDTLLESLNKPFVKE